MTKREINPVSISPKDVHSVHRLFMFLLTVTFYFFNLKASQVQFIYIYKIVNLEDLAHWNQVPVKLYGTS